jgi:hypothetical protein
MRFLFSVLFIAILLSKTAYSVFWQVNFYLNQKEIADKECENKNRPEMHCNGKCFLAKQLKKAEAELESQKEKQEGSFSHLKVIESPIFISSTAIYFELNLDKLVQKKSFFKYKNSYLFELDSNFFHPPCANFNV